MTHFIPGKLYRTRNRLHLSPILSPGHTACFEEGAVFIYLGHDGKLLLKVLPRGVHDKINLEYIIKNYKLLTGPDSKTYYIINEVANYNLDEVR